MKHLFLLIPISILGFCVIQICNLYPFGYPPIKQGEYYEIVHRHNKGTPIETTYTYKVRIDSIYEGYVIRATCPDGSIYTNGTTLRSFVGEWTLFGPDSYRKISKEEFQKKNSK